VWRRRDYSINSYKKSSRAGKGGIAIVCFGWITGLENVVRRSKSNLRALKPINKKLKID